VLDTALRSVARRHLKINVGYFPAMLVAVLSIAWLLQAGADRYLRLAWGIRCCLLGLDVAIVLALVWRYVVMPVRERLDRRKAALLVERAMPEFDSSLISAVDFCATSERFAGRTPAMLEKFLEQVSERVRQRNLALQVISARPLQICTRWAGVALAVLLLGIGAAGWKMSSLLGQRIFLSHTPLPGDTELAGLSGDFMVEAGADATLAVQATGVVPPAGSLVITTLAGESSTLPVSLSRSGGQGIYRYVVKNVREPFHYQFRINDGTSPESRVTVNIPPTLRSIHFVQTYPDYTHLPSTVMSPGNLRLLEGSKLKIEGVASEALGKATLVIKGDDTSAPFVLAADPANFSVELPVPPTGWKSMSVKLETPDGRVSSNEPVYRVDLITDRPPTVGLTLPKKDRITVVPGAKVGFAYRVSDDFGLRSLDLHYRVFRPGVSGVLTPMEERSMPIPFDSALKSASGTTIFDLGNLIPTVTPGCSINCWVEAQDSRPGSPPGKTLSKEKVVAIVSEEEKRVELLDLMQQRAKDIERLSEQQRGMNEKSDGSIHGK
jgi:hypothetical protein